MLCQILIYRQDYGLSIWLSSAGRLHPLHPQIRVQLGKFQGTLSVPGPGIGPAPVQSIGFVHQAEFYGTVTLLRRGGESAAVIPQAANAAANGPQGPDAKPVEAAVVPLASIGPVDCGVGPDPKEGAPPVKPGACPGKPLSCPWLKG